MVATLTSIYRREESLHIQGIRARYRVRPARARWGWNNRSVSEPAEYFRGGTRAIGVYPGKNWAVHFCATAPSPRSHHRYSRLGQKLRPDVETVEVMRLRVVHDIQPMLSSWIVGYISKHGSCHTS